MILALYTSRVILKILGETDFGVYNVVVTYGITKEVHNFSLEIWQYLYSL